MLPDTEDGRNRAIRHSLARRLLDDPVLYYSDLTEEERGYLDRQRGPLLKRLTDATGLVAEVRAEGIALIDSTGEATDLGMPEEGTDGHATLLLAEFLSERMRSGIPGPVSAGALSGLPRHMAVLAQWPTAGTGARTRTTPGNEPRGLTVQGRSDGSRHSA